MVGCKELGRWWWWVDRERLVKVTASSGEIVVRIEEFGSYGHGTATSVHAALLLIDVEKF